MPTLGCIIMCCVEAHVVLKDLTAAMVFAAECQLKCQLSPEVVVCTGAADCASCVGVLLEVARTLVSDPSITLPGPILFLFNGGEETIMQVCLSPSYLTPRLVKTCSHVLLLLHYLSFA